LALGRPGKAKLCFEYVMERVQEPGFREQAQAYLAALSDVEADHTEEQL